VKYREIKPDGFLNHFVQCFWEYENEEIQYDHNILPDGYFDLIVEYENKTLSRVKLTGVWTQPINVTIPKSTKIFAVRFKLLAAEYLFSREIKSILDNTKELDFCFWEINSLHCDDFEYFVHFISNKINFALSKLKKIDNRKINLFQLIYQDKKLSVKDLSEQIFWASRQINRYFNQQFGFPLKTYLNIVRCNASYENIANGQLSPKEDFFDQSHFIKEIKKHTGTTPTELLQNKKDRFLQLKTKNEK
jgi:AraC-like DNA-binding protein